jgi:subtilisin family serine protease
MKYVGAVAAVCVAAIVLAAGVHSWAASAAEPTSHARAAAEPGPSPEPEPEPEPPGKRSAQQNQNPSPGAAASAFGRTRTLDDNRWEYLLVGGPAAVARAEVEIERARGSILRGDELPALGLSQRAVDLENRITLAAMRQRLAQQGIAVALDRNSIFTPADAGRAYAPDLVGASGPGGCRLTRAVRIGLIDGPVDTARGGLVSVPVVSRSVLDDTDEPADPDHATGLVSLIAAPTGSAVVSGLAVGASIFDAVAFSSDGDRNGMRLDHFARALDWLISERVDIVNMSITGPRNSVLSVLLTQADAQGAILIAAAGNEGRTQVAFPAADPHVIAITAIDARLKRFRSANTGAEIAFAAPGVDLLVVGESGGGYRSGTSYAAAIASAVVAHELGNGTRGREDIIAALRMRTQDLGAPGRDSQFGWGLLRLSGC